MIRALSQRSQAVLRLIGQGRSYSEIVDCVPDCTYADIFAAAAEAMEAAGEKPTTKGWLARFRERFPRAYRSGGLSGGLVTGDPVSDGLLIADLSTARTPVGDASTRFGRQRTDVGSLDRRVSPDDARPGM